MAVINNLGGGSVNFTSLDNALDDMDLTLGVYRSFSVTNTLTNCTTSNSSITTGECSIYSATITANSGYTLNGASVSITMNGVDITSTTYNNGVITISGVSGNIVIVISAVSSGSPIYGVSWVNDTTTTMTRTDDSVGKTFAINSSTGTIASDFNDVFPWNEASIVTDNYGNKFLHFPDMYFRVGKDANGDINSVAVSKTQGSDGSWYLCSAFDYGLYGGSLNRTKLESKSGQTRLGSVTRDQFRGYAGNNTETGYVYHQLDLKHKIVLLFLWWIEWATKDSDSIMKGHVSGSPSSSGSKVTTGGTDILTTPSGFNTSTWQMRYHYIEDLVGNQWEFIDGIYAGSTSIADYVTDNPIYFSDTTLNMSQLSWRDPASNCIKAFKMDDNKPFLVMPSKTTGATDYTQAFCDRIYNPSTQYPIVYSGANYNSTSASTGLSFFFRNTMVSSISDLTGGRLLRQEVSNG